MHKDWCGQKCSECTKNCNLDNKLFCSPDCPNLGPKGGMHSKECYKCDSFKAKQEAMGKYAK